MRLTKQTNYAVRMLMYCAANEGKLSRIPEIARAYGVSELFLFKILQPLNKAGLVETVRGRNGGVRLGKPAEKISLFDVVRVTEDSFAMAECFEDGAVECPLVDSCGLNSALRNIRLTISSRRARRSTSCSVSTRKCRRPCPFPPPDHANIRTAKAKARARRSRVFLL